MAVPEIAKPSTKLLTAEGHAPINPNLLSWTGEQPWRWGKAWWANEVAWLKFLVPVTLALNIPLSFRAIFQTAKRECRGLRATWKAFR